MEQLVEIQRVQQIVNEMIELHQIGHLRRLQSKQRPLLEGNGRCSRGAAFCWTGSSSPEGIIFSETNVSYADGVLEVKFAYTCYPQRSRVTTHSLVVSRKQLVSFIKLHSRVLRSEILPFMTLCEVQRTDIAARLVIINVERYLRVGMHPHYYIFSDNERSRKLAGLLVIK